MPKIILQMLVFTFLSIQLCPAMQQAPRHGNMDFSTMPWAGPDAFKTIEHNWATGFHGQNAAYNASTQTQQDCCWACCAQRGKTSAVCALFTCGFCAERTIGHKKVQVTYCGKECGECDEDCLCCPVCVFRPAQLPTCLDYCAHRDLPRSVERAVESGKMDAWCRVNIQRRYGVASYVLQREQEERERELHVLGSVSYERQNRCCSELEKGTVDYQEECACGTACCCLPWCCKIQSNFVVPYNDLFDTVQQCIEHGNDDAIAVLNQVFKDEFGTGIVHQVVRIYAHGEQEKMKVVSLYEKIFSHARCFDFAEKDSDGNTAFHTAAERFTGSSHDPMIAFFDKMIAYTPAVGIHPLCKPGCQTDPVCLKKLVAQAFMSFNQEGMTAFAILQQKRVLSPDQDRYDRIFKKIEQFLQQQDELIAVEDC